MCGVSLTGVQKYTHKLAAFMNGSRQTDHNNCWWVDFIFELKVLAAVVE